MKPPVAYYRLVLRGMSQLCFQSNPDQRRCLTIEKPLGRRVLISRALLAELVGSGHATAHDGSDLVSVRVDHVRDRDGDAAEWMFRLVPVRWSRTDARDEADSELLLAVWPD